MSATPSSLMAHINDLNERDDYEGIIKFIEALSPEEQTADVIGQLARAYNNLAKAGEVEPLEKALRLLDSIAPSDRENHYCTFGVPIRFSSSTALLSHWITGRRRWSTNPTTKTPKSLFSCRKSS